MHTSYQGAAPGRRNSLMDNVIRWVDSEARAAPGGAGPGAKDRINWVRCLPFILVHAGCAGVLWTGWSPVAVAVCIALFWMRMFAITAFYHRYFSHRSFKANRTWQFVFAVLGNTAAQRGPLWWASHHRRHHRYSDGDGDIHSPLKRGFFRSHLGWFMTEEGFRTDYSVISDLARYPELRFLNRFDVLVPVLFACLVYGIGAATAALWPESGTSGWQMLVWGFFISTVVLFHATFTIKSLGHLWGSRRFETRDQSRNNMLLALLTLGEGWHNNHHRFALSARQGFYWWEIDITYLLLKLMRSLGIIRDLNPVPSRILEEGRAIAGTGGAACETA
ncbi:MAG: acyl-CoA desaturase [Gammaproteobacteria bacterium]